jgi:hypothetical protein
LRGPRNTGDPHQSSLTSQVFGRSPVLRTGQVFPEAERKAGQVSGVHQRGVEGRARIPPPPPSGASRDEVAGSNSRTSQRSSDRRHAVSSQGLS